MTDDVDIFVRADQGNLTRLRDWLAAHEAQEMRRRPLDKVIKDLAAGGTARLRTDLGALDVLAEIPADGDFGFGAILERASQMSLGRQRISVIALDDLIAIKEQTGRAKDMARLPELRRLRELL